MLLAAATLAPIAQAQQSSQTGVLDKSTADKILVYPGERRTGIAFHMTACANPNAIAIETRADDFDLASYQVINNTQVGNHQGTGDSHLAVGRVNYLEVAPNRTDLADGVHTVSIKRCAAAPVDYLVTLAVWHDQGENSDRPASRHVQGIAASEDTGVVIHRSRASCRFTDVRLAAGAPDWLELRKHRTNGTADGVGGRRFTVRMEKDHADDRHVRVRFKDDAEPPAGMQAFTVVIARTASSGAGCAGVRTAAYTLGYTLNIRLGASWDNQGRQSSTVVSGLSASDLGGPLATEMGPRIHHSSSMCRWTDAKLADGGSFLGLQLHNSTGAVGAATTSFSDVLMRRGAAGDHHIRVVYRASQAVPAGTVTAAVELKPAARCANYVGIPGPQTLSFTATIGAAIANPDPWTAKGFNQATPSGPFSPRAIANSRRYSEVDTGIYLGYRIGTCLDYHYSLLNHREKFSAYFHDGDRNSIAESTTIDTEYSFFGSSYSFSSNDSHGGFNFVFAPGVSVPPGSVLTLNVLLSKFRANNSCGNPAPITLSYRLTISPVAAWGTLANDVAAATMLFAPAAVKASASATDTGLRFNRGVAMSVCANVDVELPGGNSRYMELQKYNGTATDGAAASRFTIAMHSGATGRPVGLQFKAGADVPAGTLTVQVVARPDNCSHAEAPIPLTVKYELLVSDRQLWQVHARDSLGRVLALSPLATDTGVVAHRSLSGCEAMDVSLADDAPAWARLQQYNPSGPVGSPARVQVAVPMKGTGAADDRHVRLLIAPGADLPGARLTIGIRVAANAAACGTGSDIPAVQKTDSVMKLGDAWGILSGDNATATALFPPASLRAATAATDTGLRFHRGTAACPQVDVSVRPTAFMEVRKYNGNAVDGAAAAALANVRMQAGHADDRLVGLQFKAGVTLPAGLFTATVVAKAATGCTASNAPQPLTLAYELAVLDAWPWRAAAQDNFGAPAQLDTLELEGSGPRPAGLRLQRNSRACSSTDVALAADAPAYLSLQRHSANGPDGAAARSLAGVNMSGSGANDRHVQIAIAGGTALEAGTTVAVSLTVSANSSCSGAVGVPAAQELVGYVMISGGVLETTEAALQVGTALAVRALGAETLGAVMARPGAAMDASASAQLLGMLAAKEAELESGEIDLREFLAGQDFSLPLSSSASGLPSGVVLWGRAAKYDVGSAVENGPQVDSDLFSGSFGVDYRFGENWLLGLGYGRHEMDGMYGNRGVSGSYQLDLDLFQPYVAARMGPGWLAAYGSQGSGELLVESRDLDLQPDLKADYTGWGLGWYNDIERWDLRLRAGASAGELEFEENRLEMNAAAGAARLAVAYAPGRDLVEGLPLQPEFEVAWADEWGDAAGDASWLVALVFEYAGTGPMHLRTAYRRAVSGGDLAGVELDLRVDPSRGGLGPSFALRPRYGLDTGAAVFEQVSRPQGFAAGDDHGRRWRAELAYGLPVSGGVLTPYSDWSVDNQDQSRRLGLRLGTGAYGDWDLGWRRASSAADELHLELRIGE